MIMHCSTKSVRYDKIVSQYLQKNSNIAPLRDKAEEVLNTPLIIIYNYVLFQNPINDERQHLLIMLD